MFTIENIHFDEFGIQYTCSTKENLIIKSVRHKITLYIIYYGNHNDIGNNNNNSNI